MNELVEKAITKPVYFYKFNCVNEIKLVKNTLDANGFHLFPGTTAPNLSSYNMNADWMLMWTTKVLKPAVFNRMTKFQKINQFPRSNEITRKDSMIKHIHKMQEIHGKRNFDFVPDSLLLPKEQGKLRELMDRD